MIKEYVKDKQNTIFIKTLGQIRYLSALKYIDAVVGNSSSGIIEVPSFKIGIINIGNRQDGRLYSKSVIHCKNDTDSIKNAFNTLYKSDFKNIENIYLGKDTTKKIINILQNTDLSNIIIKSFYDIRK